MKAKLIQFAEDYRMTLQKYLQSGLRASPRPGIALGHTAAALGLDTLDMVRIHERALAALSEGNLPSRQLKQAEVFFSEAIGPIEQNHPAALYTQDKVRRTATALCERTKKLAVSKLSVKKGIEHQKLMRDNLKEDQTRQARILKESHRLQKRLRQLTHKLITLQENQSKKLGLQLQNEITQYLIGIQICLHTLKTGTVAKGKSLEKEIANAQLLVNTSSRSMRRFYPGEKS